MLKKIRRVGLLRLKALLLSVVLLASCDGTVFHRFEQVDSVGWASDDTLSFVYDGSSILSYGSEMEYVLQVRYGAGYRYKNLLMRVESWKDTVLISVDTLCCKIYDDNGRRLGSTAGTIYQNESDASSIIASYADTLTFKVSHIMHDNLLPDIFDVGVKMAATKR